MSHCRQVPVVWLLPLVIALAWPALVSLGAASGRSLLTTAAFLSARWPSRPVWSPDDRFVSFLWTDWKTQG